MGFGGNLFRIHWLHSFRVIFPVDIQQMRKTEHFGFSKRREYMTQCNMCRGDIYHVLYSTHSGFPSKLKLTSYFNRYSSYINGGWIYQFGAWYCNNIHSELSSKVQHRNIMDKTVNSRYGYVQFSPFFVGGLSRADLLVTYISCHHRQSIQITVKQSECNVQKN